MSILKFRAHTRKRPCASCQIQFSPLSRSHEFCPKCYRLGRAGAYLAAAHALFKATEPRR
jgi:hypothetical protein